MTMVKGLNASKKECTRKKENVCDELVEMCAPIVDYLKSKGSPYYSIIVSENEIRLVCDEACVPLNTD